MNSTNKIEPSQKMVGYKLRRRGCAGCLFLGTTIEQVTENLRNELESMHGSAADEIEPVLISAFEVTQQDIDFMPEFDGW